jgi:outer membrane protein
MISNKKITGCFIKILLFALFIFVPGELLAANKIKIGVVNADRVFQESVRGKEIIGSLKTRISREQEKIRKNQEKLNDLRNQLNKQSLVMSEDLKRKKENDYRMKLRSLQRQAKDAEEEMQISQREIRAEVLRDLMDIIKAIGKKEGFTYIVTSEFVIYSDKNIDITNRVIGEYNKKYRRQRSSKKK